MSITIDLPEEIERHLESEWGDLPRRALEALATEGYRSGALSVGQVAEVLGLSIWETEVLLKQRDIGLEYRAEDLKRDIEASEGALAR